PLSLFPCFFVGGQPNKEKGKRRRPPHSKQPRKASHTLLQTRRAGSFIVNLSFTIIEPFDLLESFHPQETWPSNVPPRANRLLPRASATSRRAGSASASGNGASSGAGRWSSWRPPPESAARCSARSSAARRTRRWR